MSIISSLCEGCRKATPYRHWMRCHGKGTVIKVVSLVMSGALTELESENQVKQQPFKPVTFLHAIPPQRDVQLQLISISLDRLGAPQAALAATDLFPTSFQLSSHPHRKEAWTSNQPCAVEGSTCQLQVHMHFTCHDPYTLHYAAFPRVCPPP